MIRIQFNPPSLVRTAAYLWIFSILLQFQGPAQALGQESDETQAAQSVNKIVFHSGVTYANVGQIDLQLNLAEPLDRHRLRPAILCIHGGGFRAGNRESYDSLIRKLAQQGYVALTVTYRLSPQHPFPAAVHDVKAAVRWLRANAEQFHIDPDRIGVTGQSAGGHLAQFLAVSADVDSLEGEQGNLDQSSAVRCCVNFYGTSDLTKSYGKSVDAAEVLPLWLGGDLSTHRAQHILASPLNWVTPSAAPTLLIHGTEDPYVNIEQAVFMHARLQAVNVDVEFLKIDGAGHGFKGQQKLQADQAMLRFFTTHLKDTAVLQAADAKVPKPEELDSDPSKSANGILLTEQTLTFGEGQSSPAETIESASWLTGNYSGDGFGGTIEECWGPHSSGSMLGTFRLVNDGALNFSEFFILEEHEGSLRLRLKHFDKEFDGWEDKDKFVEFPLVRIEKGKLFFKGLTYVKENDGNVTVYLAMRRKDGTFNQVTLPLKRTN